MVFRTRLNFFDGTLTIRHVISNNIEQYVLRTFIIFPLTIWLVYIFWYYIYIRHWRRIYMNKPIRPRINMTVVIILKTWKFSTVRNFDGMFKKFCERFHNVPVLRAVWIYPHNTYNISILSTRSIYYTPHV